MYVCVVACNLRLEKKFNRRLGRSNVCVCVCVCVAEARCRFPQQEGEPRLRPGRSNVYVCMCVVSCV